MAVRVKLGRRKKARDLTLPYSVHGMSIVLEDEDPSPCECLVLPSCLPRVRARRRSLRLQVRRHCSDQPEVMVPLLQTARPC